MGKPFYVSRSGDKTQWAVFQNSDRIPGTYFVESVQQSEWYNDKEEALRERNRMIKMSATTR